MFKKNQLDNIFKGLKISNLKYILALVYSQVKDVLIIYVMLFKYFIKVVVLVLK